MGSVFIPAQVANSLLTRFRRANSALEEIKQGNIQRECQEEICSYEEAREAFENDEKTKMFWEEYVRENNPSESGHLVWRHSERICLIVPVLVALLVFGVILALWRSHLLKMLRRRLRLSNSSRESSPAFVDIDLQERNYHLSAVHTSEFSGQNIPAHSGFDVAAGQMGSRDLPPSYEKAMGREELPTPV